MAGRDQSVNLSGMLGQIADTVGEMGKAYDPVMKAAMRPRGSMQDPNHLNRLAEWASSNGDSASATRYTNQASQLQDDMDKARGLEFAKGTAEAAMGGQRAATTGDVTNLDRAISNINERVQSAPDQASVNELLRQRERLEGMRPEAKKVEVGNHVKAIGTIDKTLDDPQLDAVARKGLTDRRAQLLENPDVQMQFNQQEIAKWDQEQSMLKMEADQYVMANTAALNDAITTGDSDEMFRIVDDAPPMAQSALRQMQTTLQGFADDFDKVEQLTADTAVAFDFDTFETDVRANVPEDLRAEVDAAMSALRKSEANRAGGELTQGEAIRNQGLRKQLNDAVTAAHKAAGQQRYQQTVAQEAATARKVAELEAQRDNWSPATTDVVREAKMMADAVFEQSGGKADDRSATDYTQYIPQAKAILTERHVTKTNGEILALVGTEEAQAEAYSSEQEAVIEQGMAKGASREEVIAYIEANGGFDAAMAGSQLSEVSVPKRDLRSGELPPPKNKTAASSVYGESGITQMLEAIRDGLAAKGERARNKIEDNPYGG
jgi:hypothetical protein